MHAPDRQTGRLRAAFLWLASPPATRLLAASAALGGLLAVVGGAASAHALRTVLPAERLALLDTAIQFQMYHSLALLALAVPQRTPAAGAWFGLAGACFVVGMLLFCGSLWVLGLTGLRPGVPLAPAGGILLMTGWLSLLIGVLRHER